MKFIRNIFILCVIASAGWFANELVEPSVIQEQPIIINQLAPVEHDLADVAYNARFSAGQMFGQNDYRSWSGSGFLIDERTILTAGHCVEDAVNVDFIFSDGTIAEVLGWSHSTLYDVGYIHIKPVSFTPLFIREVPVSLGEEVVVIGCPFGIEDIVTFGRVSAEVHSLSNWEGDVFIVDAWAAPGNSGGAVLDADGFVVGILVGGPTRCGASSGVCIPVHIIRLVEATVLNMHTVSDAS
jgi:S1-C subfamily serine protease